jgi:hypothetical protein
VLKPATVKQSTTWLEHTIDPPIDQLPIFTPIRTILVSAGVIQIVKIDANKQTKKDRRLILGAGLFALFVGLLVFPIQTFHMLEAIKAAGEQQPSIVMGGLYISFVPMFYGLMWFLISLAGWLFYKRNET